MQVLASRDSLARALSSSAGAPTGRRAVVMTMGALHDGHLSLVRRARALVGDTGQVVVTIFVNPLQFGAGEDLDRYPRTLDADLARLRTAGVDLVFTPDDRQVYPRPVTVRIDPGPLGAELEGAVRPGHFAGVLTLVAKMCHLVSAGVAVFGEKDYQQLVLIKAMVADLDLPVRVVGAPIVRAADGLARSSRNRYLDEAQRARAGTLWAALQASARAAAERADAVGVHSAAARVLERAGIVPEYLQLRSVDLAPAPVQGPARMLVAARFGAIRLIDNAAVELGGVRADRDVSDNQGTKE